MKIHPQALKVQLAKAGFSQAMLDLMQVHSDITMVEWLQILNGEQQSILKTMLRHERYPDNPDEPADVE